MSVSRENKYPSAKEVDDMHRNSDVNKRAESIHHTLGTGRTQASPGDHNHDGSSSVALMDGVVFTGSRGTGTASVLNQILEALEKIGAVNSTTA